jgi:CRP-like cAMP-binding protein
MTSTPHSSVRALRDVPIFADLDDRDMLLVVGESANLLWPAGSTVFAVGEEAQALYVVVAGRVVIVGDDGADGDEVGPGGYFGEQSLLAATTHSKTVRAIEDVELLVLPRGVFASLVDADPDLAERLRSRMDDRIA